MAYTEHHVFFRCNHRDPLEACCSNAVWYTCADRHGIDDIIDSHVLGGHTVERLKI